MQDAQFRNFQPVVGRRMSNDLRRAVKFQSPRRGLGFFPRTFTKRLDGRLKHFFLWYLRGCVASVLFSTFFCFGKKESTFKNKKNNLRERNTVQNKKNLCCKCEKYGIISAGIFKKFF